MRWTAFPPVGIAYEALEGPFSGSTLFLCYTPRGKRTGVVLAGEFVSPTIPASRLKRSVDAFFSLEFQQDANGLRAEARTRRHAHVRRSRGS